MSSDDKGALTHTETLNQTGTTITASMDLDDALGRLYTLSAHLGEISKRDPEQEVRGMALPVMDAVIVAAREHVPPGDPVLATITDVISPESVAAGEPVRAIDALLVVNQLASILERQSPPMDLGTGESIFGPLDRDW